MVGEGLAWCDCHGMAWHGGVGEGLAQGWVKDWHRGGSKKKRGGNGFVQKSLVKPKRKK